MVPDGYFTLEGEGRRNTFAVEIDRSTVEEKPFKEKVRAYGEWKVTGAYERQYSTKSLRVLRVVVDVSRDSTRLERIKRWTEAEGGRSLFWFAMLDVLTPETVLRGEVWQKAGSEGRHALLSPTAMRDRGFAHLAQGSGQTHCARPVRNSSLFRRSPVSAAGSGPPSVNDASQVPAHSGVRYTASLMAASRRCLRPLNKTGTTRDGGRAGGV